MKYLKQALSFPEQADRLLARGLLTDRDTLIARLQSVNYYRLSAYWYTFRVVEDAEDRLMPGTTLEIVWDRYVFDRQLRFLVMDAVERVEVAIRTQIVNQHVLAHGPFGYLDRGTLPGIPVEAHRKLLEKVRNEARNSQEEFVRHYFGKYTMEHDLPLWIACELMTFGNMLALFMGLRTRVKKDVAQCYGLTVPVLGSWLKTLNQVRNICAHHARLWNRVYGVRAVMPDRLTYPEWHAPVFVDGERTFGILTVLYYLLKQVAPQSRWRDRLTGLFDKHPDVPLRFMGFPENWMECPIWKK
jgi:abortive infection bacteriophage resistance protein